MGLTSPGALVGHGRGSLLHIRQHSARTGFPDFPMSIALVVNDPKEWDFDIPGIDVVAARTYLTDAKYSQARNLKVFNLCRHYRYQATGYYVTLLAEARGHRPQPSIAAIQDFRSAPIARDSSNELSDLIQQSLSRLRSSTFQLSIYFGRNMAEKYARLSLKLFNLYPAPMLRAYFSKVDGEWSLDRVAPISAIEIPKHHRPFISEAARKYFERGRWAAPKQKRYRYDLAILTHPGATSRPSNDGAIKRFIKAANELNMSAELITKNDFGTLGEYDALFIRETTAVNHHTYRFARRAESLGLVVIDDPQSILRCTNKVFLKEILERNGVPIPRTMVVHRGNVDLVPKDIGFPCVLKQPDSSFSLGVFKVETPEELENATEQLFTRSDLIVAQAWCPSEFDWRVGMIDGSPIFAARYHMAPKHWQIVKHEAGDKSFGKVEPVPLGLVPKGVLRAAVKSGRLIGDGFYGVDLKEVDGQPLVIEVNDNPNFDHGYEDKLSGDEIFERIMRVFLTRIEQAKERTQPA